jgi:alpha-D-xyloside xylohydrolase
VYDFAADKAVWNMTDEFMFGRSILATPIVAPQYTEEKVFREDAMSGWDKNKTTEESAGKVDFGVRKSVTKYLPKGADWYNFWTEEFYKGGRQVIIETQFDEGPMFVKAGTILPLAPVMQYAEESKWDNLDIIVYPGADATFTLYEDEGDNYNYEKGVYSTIEFRWNDKNKQLIIDDVKGEYPGMLTKRKFNVRIVGNKEVKEVEYTGKKIVM